MGLSVDNQFALGVIQGATEGERGGSERHALVPAESALDPAVEERDAQGAALVGTLPAVEFIANGITE